VLDTEALLAPVSDEAPSGVDLSYDAEFLELEQVSQGKPEQQFGDTVIPAEEPDWQEVAGRAEALLGRSKDLRVALLLTRALTRLYNIEGAATGLSVVTEMLSRYWDTLHPELDHEDNDDPTMRLNALAPLADSETFLRELRSAVVAASPQHGRVSVRDVLVAGGKIAAASGDTLGRPEVEGIMRAVAAENTAPLEAGVRSMEAVRALEALLDAKGVLTQAPELGPLKGSLYTLSQFCKEALEGSGEAADAVADAEHGVPAQASYARANVPGQIATRDDAIRALDSVCRYIEQAEPSNPAPLLIRRAQRLMSKSFVEIIEDLAPESLAQIQSLAGFGQGTSSESE
jgi:type VI secretion system protein ImpA